MSKENTEEYVVEDVTEDQLIANEELEQDLPEVSEQQEVELSFSDSIKSILLGEEKDEEEEEDEDEEDMEESADSDEDEEEDEEDIKESNEEKIKSKILNLLIKRAGPGGNGYTKKDYTGMINRHWKDVSDMKTPGKMANYIHKMTFGEAVEEEAVEEEATSIAHDDVKADAETVKNIKKSVPAKAPEPKGKGAGKTKKEAVDGEKVADQAAKVAEALDLLMTNESSLSEDFKSQASTLFEAAIAEKSVQIQEKLEEKYNQELNEEVETIRESLINKIDSYLEYVVESWIEENTQQVESTLRSEIAENFITSLKDVFVENYIDVPAEKRDLVEELNELAEETSDKLANAEVEIAGLKEQIETFEREEVFNSLTEDLSDAERCKFKSIVEDVEYGNKESFSKKVEVIKGSLFESLSTQEDSTVVEDTTDDSETEIIVEGETKVDEITKLPASMRHYVDALNK